MIYMALEPHRWNNTIEQEHTRRKNRVVQPSLGVLLPSDQHAGKESNSSLVETQTAADIAECHFPHSMHFAVNNEHL